MSSAINVSCMERHISRSCLNPLTKLGPTLEPPFFNVRLDEARKYDRLWRGHIARKMTATAGGQS